MHILLCSEVAQQKALTAIRRGKESQVRSELFKEELRRTADDMEGMVRRAVQANEMADAETILRTSLEDVVPDERSQMEVAASEKLAAIASVDPEFAALSFYQTHQPGNVLERNRERNRERARALRASTAADLTAAWLKGSAVTAAVPRRPLMPRV